MYEIEVEIDRRPTVRAEVATLADAAALASALAMASVVRTVRVRLPDGAEIDVRDLQAARRC
jgi:cobalamin biosynthesis protein CbiD